MKLATGKSLRNWASSFKYEFHITDVHGYSKSCKNKTMLVSG